MLQSVLKVFGVEIEYEIARLRYHLELLRRQITIDLKAYGRDAALVVGLMAGAGALLVGVAIIGLIAIYHFVAEHHGFYAALGITASILMALALIMVGIASARARWLAQDPAAPVEPLRPEPVKVYAATRSSSLKLDLAGLINDPGPDATVLESVVHQVKVKGAEAAENALGQAEEAVRSGSRGAMLTTLVLAGLVGAYYGRSKAQLPHGGANP